MTILTARYSAGVEYARSAHSSHFRKGTSISHLYHLLGVTPNVIRKEFFPDFDYAGFADPKNAMALLDPAMEHVLSVAP